MEIYVPGQDGDLELLRWWAELHETGEIESLVGPSLYPIAAFTRHFTNENAQLYYLADEKGWRAAAWTFPFMSGGTWGLWIRKDTRHTGAKEVFQFILDSLDDAFSRYPVLVNIVKVPENIEKTKKLDYTYIGSVPYIFEGEEAHFLAMTKYDWESHSQKWRAH